MALKAAAIGNLDCLCSRSRAYENLREYNMVPHIPMNETEDVGHKRCASPSQVLEDDEENGADRVIVVDDCLVQIAVVAIKYDLRDSKRSKSESHSLVTSRCLPNYILEGSL